VREQTPGQSGVVVPGPEEELRREVELRLRTERLFNRITGKLSQPRNKDVTEYYRKHKDEYFSPELVHAKHIIKNVDEKTDEETALASIKAVQAQLQDGTSFEEVADLHSDCPGRGGDLGFFERGQMVPEFEDVVFRLEPGQVTGIFRSPFGFHIAKVYEKRPAGPRRLEEVRADIEQLLYREKQERAMEQYVDRLRSKAEVKEVPRA
jgi:parvulin-like peptidyl-prolyl isomerase